MVERDPWMATEKHCPDCPAVLMVRNGDGSIECPECGYTEEQ